MPRNQLRIIGGGLRGRRISTVPGRAVRPTGDRAREALFDVLGPRVEGSKVLDLFAGSGALGLEAVSRGGARAVLVERAPSACRVIRENITRLGLGDRVELIVGDYEKALKRLSRRGLRFDLVLADPPYAALDLTPNAGRERMEKILCDLSGCGTVQQGGIFVLEHFSKAAEPELPAGWHRFRRLAYGRAGLTFYAYE